MLRCLSLYLFRQTLVAFVFTLAGVSFVVLFAQSFRLLSLVIDNASTAAIFFQLMGLLVPTFLPLVVPVALGIGTLFAFLRLSSDSELVVMESAGLSPLRLSAPAFSLACLVTMFCFFLTLWATPAAHRALLNLQYSVKNAPAIAGIRPGAFNDLADGLTLYTKTRGADGGLSDILVHDVRKPETPLTIMAETGAIYVQDGAPQIVVFKGKRQEIDRRTGHLSQLSFDRYVIDLSILRSKQRATRTPDPREQPFTDLLSPAKGETQRRASLPQIKAELHQRLATPWLALSYAAIALATVLVGDFNRRGMSRRVFTATIAMIILQTAILSLTSYIARAPSLYPALYAVAIAPAFACFWLLRRAGKTTIPPFFRRKSAP